MQPHLILLGIAPLSLACTTAHTYFHSCVYDVATGINNMQIQVWDNSNEVCNGGASDPAGSDNTWYHLDCGNGAFVDVLGYGGTLNYTSSDGYFVSLASSDGHKMGFACGQTDDTVSGGLEAEHVYTDQYCANCNTAQLCDYRDYCDFDASCH